MARIGKYPKILKVKNELINTIRRHKDLFNFRYTSNDMFYSSGVFTINGIEYEFIKHSKCKGLGRGRLMAIEIRKKDKEMHRQISPKQVNALLVSARRLKELKK